jgi:hypothetical protein
MLRSDFAGRCLVADSHVPDLFSLSAHSLIVDPEQLQDRSGAFVADERGEAQFNANCYMIVVTITYGFSSVMAVTVEQSLRNLLSNRL